MATVRKPRAPKAPKVVEFVYPDFYYQYIYKIRMAWTGYDVPVRVNVDGLYLEAYIRPTKNTATIDDMVEVTIDASLAYLFTSIPDTVTVRLADVHPSGRKLLQFEQDKLIPCPITHSSLPERYFPKPEIDITRIEKLFESSYPKCNFSLLEIECMLGLDWLDSTKQEEMRPLIHKELNKYKVNQSKYCLISHTWGPAYTYSKKLMDGPIAISIPELHEQYKDCTRCHLGEKRKARGAPVVFGRGKQSKLDLFLIGEAPGMQEERDGIPFNPTAPAGGNLDRVMRAAGIDQATVYITNSVLCRPAPEEGEKGENGKPDNISITCCNSRLKNEIAILQPKVVVLLGSVAYRAFFGKDVDGITKNLGWAEQLGSVKTYVLLHPSYIARQLSFAQKDEAKTAEIKQDYLNHWLEIKQAITNI